MLPRLAPHWPWAALAGFGALSGAAFYRYFNRSALPTNSSTPARIHIVSQNGTMLSVETFDEATRVMKSLREIAELPEAEPTDRPGRRFKPS